jgi:hypothetical protein
MSQYISFIDTDGNTISANPEDIGAIYPYPQDMTKTVLNFNNGRIYLTALSVAAAVALFTSPNTVDGTVTVDQGTSPWAISESYPGATLLNGVETAVTVVAAQIVAANLNRKKLIVQNNGLGAIRIGAVGVTATTGVRLITDATVILDMPHCPTNAVYAIRETVDSVVLVQEVT